MVCFFEQCREQGLSSASNKILQHPVGAFENHLSVNRSVFVAINVETVCIH